MSGVSEEELKPFFALFSRLQVPATVDKDFMMDLIRAQSCMIKMQTETIQKQDEEIATLKKQLEQEAYVHIGCK